MFQRGTYERRVFAFVSNVILGILIGVAASMIVQRSVHTRIDGIAYREHGLNVSVKYIHSELQKTQADVAVLKSAAIKRGDVREVEP